MAFSNIEKDMQSFFNAVAKGVREDMDKNFVHHITINFTDTALGFHRGASHISGSGDYLGGNEKQSWENVIRKICKNWDRGSTGLKPGQVFRTVKTGSPSAGYSTLKGIAIPNASVVNFSRTECTIQLLVASKSGGGSMKQKEFITAFRKLVWDKWNKDNSKTLKYGKEVGQNTNFGHSQQSTVGLKQMSNLDEARTNEPDNPFTDARAFIGKAGFAKTISLENYVKNQLTGAGASITFSQKYINGKLEQVVVGRIDPSNKAGSEVTDKKQFDKYIKKYYREHFLNKFNDKSTKDKKAVAKSMGFNTIADFKSSESYSSKAKKEIASKVAKELTKGKTLKQIKAPAKPKVTTRKKKFRPKKSVGKALISKGALQVREKGKRQKAANQQANPLALKELINAALPEEILERMNPPALRNRTGRFRRSAQVTNVLVGPRGGVEAEYTYMKMPYQTFEPGYAQGSTFRDPRKIIGESIREIAQKLTGNRFIKVRRI